MKGISRNQFLKFISVAMAAGLTKNIFPDKMSEILKRKIPKTGEEIPAIGMGTWKTFDVSLTSEVRERLIEVLRIFRSMGGKVIDSSPMYGKAENVVGELLKNLDRKDFFLATKVWTHGKENGQKQIAESFDKMNVGVMDLFQVHNLSDIKTQLSTLYNLKEKGKIRYIGITHYVSSAFSEIEKIMQTEKIDFIQIPYSIALRDAERRILPVAGDSNIAVLVNRPFEGGDLFSRMRNRSIPPIAQEIGCTTWAQIFLKFILSEPNVTCVIPATGNPKHIREKMEAGMGIFPDRKQRDEILKSLSV